MQTTRFAAPSHSLLNCMEIPTRKVSETTQEMLTDQGCANAAGMPLDEAWDVSLFMGLNQKGWICRVPEAEKQLKFPDDLMEIFATARSVGANHVLLRD